VAIGEGEGGRAAESEEERHRESMAKGGIDKYSKWRKMETIKCGSMHETF
jgi:hypothetical protein